MARVRAGRRGGEGEDTNVRHDSIRILLPREKIGVFDEATKPSWNVVCPDFSLQQNPLEEFLVFLLIKRRNIYDSCIWIVVGNGFCGIVRRRSQLVGVSGKYDGCVDRKSVIVYSSAEHIPLLDVCHVQRHSEAEQWSPFFLPVYFPQVQSKSR